MEGSAIRAGLQKGKKLNLTVHDCFLVYRNGFKFCGTKTNHQTINFSSTPTHLAIWHPIGKHRENGKSYKMN